MPVSVHSWLPDTVRVYVLAGVVVGVGVTAGDGEPAPPAGWVLPVEGDEEAATAIVTPGPVAARCRCLCAADGCVPRAFSTEAGPGSRAAVLAGGGACRAAVGSTPVSSTATSTPAAPVPAPAAAHSRDRRRRPGCRGGTTTAARGRGAFLSGRGRAAVTVGSSSVPGGWWPGTESAPPTTASSMPVSGTSPLIPESQLAAAGCAGPAEARPRPAAASLPTGPESADTGNWLPVSGSQTGLSAAGLSPAGLSAAGLSPAGLSTAGLSPAGLSPAGLSTPGTGWPAAAPQPGRATAALAAAASVRAACRPGRFRPGRVGQRRLGRGEPAERPGHRGWQPARGRAGRAELGPQLSRAGPLAGVLGQAALDQRAEPPGQPVGAGLAVHHPVEQRRHRPGAERALPGRGEREQRAQAEHVAGRADQPARGLFR